MIYQIVKAVTTERTYEVEANSAFYDGLTLWIYFDYEYGIYYDTDVEICDKIRKRDDELASKC